MNQLHGVAVASGQALAHAWWLRRDFAIPPGRTSQWTSADLRTKVSERLQQAKQRAESEIAKAVLEAHLLIATDPDLWNRIEQLSRTGVGLKDAIESAITDIAVQFESMPDEYWRARADDVRDVGHQLVQILQGQDPWPWYQQITSPVIIVADVLYPSDAALLPIERVAGFLMAQGSITSHVAILSRAYGVPAIILGEAVHSIKEEDLLYMDGTLGTVTINPENSSVDPIVASVKEFPVITSAVVTQDNVRIHVEANIGSIADAEKARDMGADGVGLLRTEFLFDNDHAPSEEEHLEVLLAIAKIMDGKPLIVRVADIGGDKPVPYLHWSPEQNPFLGVRAIRLLRNYPDLYGAQIRAAFRIGQDYPLKMMFPMVASLEDWDLCYNTVQRVTAEFDRAWKPVPLGCMVEVPSAVWLANELAQRVDFFSVGTNDLIQYLFAADRLSPHLGEYYQPLNPAVLRALKMVIEAATRHHIPVALCGEMAGDPNNVETLVGLGLRTFSVAPHMIPQIKKLVGSVDTNHCQQIVQRSL